MFLVLGALRSLAGQEHVRTIPFESCSGSSFAMFAPRVF